MKTKNLHLAGVFFLLLSTLIITSCVEPKKTDEPEPGDKPSQERPKETISLKRAQAMYRAYEERYKAISEVSGKKEARYGWHSIDFYKNYIAYLEHQARKVDIPISGLRMYYVAYPEDDKSEKYADYQTYIYVPTYYNKKEKRHIAFDPLHIDDNGVPLPIHEIITGEKRMSDKEANTASLARSAENSIATDSDDISSVANMAEMCEPNCN